MISEVGMQTYEKLLDWVRRKAASEKYPSASKLAEALQLSSKSKLYTALKNESVPKADEFLRWVEFLGAKIFLPEELEKLNSEYYPVPKVLARPQAGTGGLQVNDTITGFYAFQYAWLRSKCVPSDCVLMEVVGDSMSPTIEEKDVVLINQGSEGKEVYPGKIYVLRIEDTIAIKRLEKHPGELILRSDNPTYERMAIPLDESTNMEIIGKVIWIGKEV